MEVKHLAFDLDGVLVDALEIHKRCFVRAWNTCVPDRGIDDAFHDKHLASRNTTQKIHTLIAMGHAHGYNFEEVLNNVSYMKQKLTMESIDEAKATVSWLPELIVAMRAQGRMIALVSNSIRATCERTLANIGVLHLFDTLVASDDDDIAANKPDPSPYLVAASRLGREPSDLVALEDSPVGLRAAKAAGCWLYVVAQPERDLDLTTFQAWLKIVDAA